MKRGGRPNEMSAKTRKAIPVRKAVREKRLELDRGCQARLIVPEVACGGRLEVDEYVGRGVRPGAQYELPVTQVLCANHHRWKTANPREARNRGLRKKSNEVPVSNSKIVPRPELREAR